MRSADLRRATRRVRIVGVFVLAGFFLLGLRAAHLTLVDERGSALGPRQARTVLHLAPARGAITDRSGAELAMTVPAPSVYAVPKQVADAPATARALSRVLGASPRFIESRLTLGGGFVYVARWIDAAQAKAIEALTLPGIGLISEPRRTYPQGALAGRLIGFANVDGAGVRGIEESEHAWLAGHAERIAVQRDARGRILAYAGHDPRGSAGGDVALTLDSALQADAEAALADTVKATGAKGGFVIAIDPSSGDVLALAEAPGFDPNQFRTAKYPDTRQRVFTDAFEPGSTFKAFLIAAALERGAVRASDRFDCEDGHWRVPGKTLRDTHPHGVLDVAGVLQVSSNIGAAKIGYALGAENHHAMLRAFGFGARTGSGFPDESPGLLRGWQRWRPVDHATISFGQGVSVTAMQLAVATAAIANGGILREPRLVAARRAPGGVWDPAPPAEGRRVLREETAAQLRGMLERVVHAQGTAVRASLEAVRVGGKTGTAQPLDPSTRRYRSDRYIGWFIGAAPIEAPRIVIVAMVDEARGIAHTGGSTAAPLFARTAATALARQGIRTQAVFGLPAPAYVGWTPEGGVPPHLEALQARWPSSPPEVGRALIAAQTPDKSSAPTETPARPVSLPPVGAPPPRGAGAAEAGERVPTPSGAARASAASEPARAERHGSAPALAQLPSHVKARP
ncbi:MAG TPA: penicillin-binding protein 2 [Myxococcota bacterium]|nr:penicillin-binding protein 2 [Myxococcota bacterium]